MATAPTRTDRRGAADALTAAAAAGARALLRGHDPTAAVRAQPAGPASGLAAAAVAGRIHAVLVLGAAGRPGAAAAALRGRAHAIDALLEAIERRGDAPGLARRARRRLEDLVARWEGPRLDGALGGLWVDRWDLDGPPPVVPAGPERLRRTVLVGGEPAGVIELPVIDGGVAPEVALDALPGRACRALIRRHLAVPASADPEALLLGEVWGRAVGAAVAGARRPRGGALVGIDVADHLAGAVPPAPACVRLSVAGAALVVVAVDPAAGDDPVDALARAATAAAGPELCRAVVREALAGRPPSPDARPLRARLADRRRERERGGGGRPADALVLGGRGGPPGSPTWRRAGMPRAAAAAVHRMAAATGEPILEAGEGRSPRAVVHSPDVLPPAPPVGERPIDRRRAGQLDIPGPPRPIPILMLHRVAASGPPSLERWRVDPAAFDELVEELVEAGWRGLALEDRARALAGGPAPGGRRVVVTFDDAYADVARHALPVLRRHGLPATVFVPTDHVGGAAAWDARFGRPAPLLDWDALADLAAAGVGIGSHCASHRHLTALAPAEVVREVACSRLALQERLGRSVTTLAYPYGDHDGAVRHLVGAAGIDCAVTCEPRISRHGDDPLALPRVEVAGGERPAGVAARLA